MRFPCLSVLSRCPCGALTVGAYLGSVLAAAVAPRHTRLCGESLLGHFVRRREYVVRWPRGPAVVAEGRLRGHCCYGIEM